MADRNYTESGYRGDDARHGFGDDMGTRVGRPDGARERDVREMSGHQAQDAPRDANPGQAPGQPSTNDDAVADGLEGSIMEGEGEGQRDVRNATQGNPDVNPEREAGKDRKTYDL